MVILRIQKNMPKLMGKKIFTIFAQKFCLSKPMYTKLFMILKVVLVFLKSNQ